MNERRYLRELRKIVLADARYPVAPPPAASDKDFCDLVNNRTNHMWSPSSFRTYRRLAMQLRAHANELQRGSWHCVRKELDGGGYIVFRHGGGLPCRVTIRRSEAERNSPLLSTEEVRCIAIANGHFLLEHYWEGTQVVEDAEDKTIRIRR